MARHVAQPFATPEQAVQTLSRLGRELGHNAPKFALFVQAYQISLASATVHLDSGRFTHPGAMRQYFTAFANRYRLALSRWLAGAPVAAPWRIAFEVASDGQAAHWRDLLLGINAHINHDLPLAARDAGLDLGSAGVYRDHMRINDALFEATPEIRHAMVRQLRPLARPAAWLCGPLIDARVGRSLQLARRLAWRQAGRLAQAGDSREARARLVRDSRATALRILARPDFITAVRRLAMDGADACPDEACPAPGADGLPARHGRRETAPAMLFQRSS